MNAVLEQTEHHTFDIAAADLCWTRARLASWGRLCREKGMGYPSMAAIERAIFGRGGRYTGPALPEDLEIIDTIVARAPIGHKTMLVESYTKDGSGRAHATRLFLSLRSYWRRRTSAELYVCRMLSEAMAGDGAN